MPNTHFRQRIGERIRYQQPISNDTIVSAVWSASVGIVDAQVDAPRDTSSVFSATVTGDSILTCQLTFASGLIRITKLLISLGP